jgi:hypothetical protein
MKRKDVYALIDGERDYQDSLGADRSREAPHSVGAYLTLLRSYAAKADIAWTDNPGDTAALDVIRKIAAIAVRCMEDHDAPTRQIPEDAFPELRALAEFLKDEPGTIVLNFTEDADSGNRYGLDVYLPFDAMPLARRLYVYFGGVSEAIDHDFWCFSNPDSSGGKMRRLADEITAVDEPFFEFLITVDELRKHYLK